MELLCPECMGVLETQDGQSARCTIHGGEFRILFSRWQPPPPPPPPVEADPSQQSEEIVLEPPAGAECVQHPEVPAVYLCKLCCRPICDTCAFAVDGGQVCPDCFVRQSKLRVARQPPIIDADPPPVPVMVPEGARCVQHPHLQATQQCKSCGAFMCATCDFALPGGIHVCPACAAAPKTDLSPRRKKLVAGSFALAVWSTIGLAILFSGALANTVRSKEDEQALGLALMLLVMLPAIIGMTLGFSAVDRRLTNPAILWVAAIWNTVLLGGFLLLCIIGNLG
jgi:hypothetical protein